MALPRDILIVDDNTDNLRVLSGILKAGGYEARPVNSGSMALKVIAARPPALILMDIMMPEMDGFEVCAAIRGEIQTQDIPLIFISALDALEEKLKAFSAGAVDYITKPFHEAEVLARIRTHLALIQAKERLKESEALNRQLFKAEGLLRMSAAIAHKFNNHLHAILGNLEMAKIHACGQPLTIRSIETAMQSADEAARLSGLILTYTGKNPVSKERMDLASCCRAALAEMSIPPEKEIRLESHLPPEGPLIQGDCQKIRQILQELFLNALEASGEKGHIVLGLDRVSATALPRNHRFPLDFKPDTAATYACVEIQDRGCGIQPRDIEKIFDPFFSTNLLGRGMGLPAVLGMVRAHQGSIAVVSTPGAGSLFRLFFPILSDSPTQA